MFVSAGVSVAGVTSVGPAMTDITRGGTSFTLDASCFPPLPPDLQVTQIAAGNNKAREGDKVTITATVANTGESAASASKTEILLDGATVIGLVDTPEIPAGGSTRVERELGHQRREGGSHDSSGRRQGRSHRQIKRDEQRGDAERTVQGNKVQNGSFSRARAAAIRMRRTGSSTGAGNATWTAGGSDGSRSVSITGNGGNAGHSGWPSWTSAPNAVTAGEMLELPVAAPCRWRVVSRQAPDSSISARRVRSSGL